MFPSSHKKLLFLKPFISWANRPFQGKGKAFFGGEIRPVIPQSETPWMENFAPKDV